MTKEPSQPIKELAEALRQLVNHKVAEATNQNQQHGLELKASGMTHEGFTSLFRRLDELSALEKTISQRGRLKFGDPDVISYNHHKEAFMRDYLPTEDQFIRLLKDIRQEYEYTLGEREAEYRRKVREELAHMISDITRQI